MPNVSFQRRRGTTTEHSTFTGLQGELTVDTTKETVVVHDGVTQGGYPLQKEAKQMTWAQLLAIPKANIIPFSDRFFITDIGISGSEWFWDGEEFSPTAPVVLGGTKLPMFYPPSGAITPSGVLTYYDYWTFEHYLVGFASSGTTVGGNSYFAGIPWTQSPVTLAVTTHAANTTYTVSAGAFFGGDVGYTLIVNTGGNICYLYVVSTTQYMTSVSGGTMPTSGQVITPVPKEPTGNVLTSASNPMPSTTNAFVVSLTKLYVPYTTASITLPPMTVGVDATLVSGQFDLADVGGEAVVTSSNSSAWYYFTILSQTKVRPRSATSTNFTITAATDATIAPHPTQAGSRTASTWCMQGSGSSSVGCTAITGTSSANNVSMGVAGYANGCLYFMVPTAITYAQLMQYGVNLCYAPWYVAAINSNRALLEKGYIYLEATSQDGSSTFSGNNPVTGLPYTTGWYYFEANGTNLREFKIYAQMYDPASLHPPREPSTKTLVVGSGFTFYQFNKWVSYNPPNECIRVEIPFGVTGELIKNIQITFSIQQTGTSIVTTKGMSSQYGINFGSNEANSITGSVGGVEEATTAYSTIRADGRIIHNNKTLGPSFTNNSIYRQASTVTSPKMAHRTGFTKQNMNDFIIVHSAQLTFYKS